MAKGSDALDGINIIGWVLLGFAALCLFLIIELIIKFLKK